MEMWYFTMSSSVVVCDARLYYLRYSIDIQNNAFDLILQINHPSLKKCLFCRATYLKGIRYG